MSRHLFEWNPKEKKNSREAANHANTANKAEFTRVRNANVMLTDANIQAESDKLVVDREKLAEISMPLAFNKSSNFKDISNISDISIPNRK